MYIGRDLSDQAVLEELGARLEKHRLNAGITQAALAKEAGISKRTLERMESGTACELVMLIRVLRVLELCDSLNNLVPEPQISPIAQLRLQGRERKRSSSRRSSPRTTKSKPSKPAAGRESTSSDASTASKWKWGE